MCLLRVMTCLAISLALANSKGSYQNELHGELELECASGYGLVRVESTYDSPEGDSDRQWTWECTKIDNLHKEYCIWYENINDFEEPMFFQCPADAFMAGVRSLYTFGPDDRLWDVKCCRIETICMHHCTLSDVIADFAADFDHSADGCHVFVGIYSIFGSESIDDREFRLQECQFGSCTHSKKHLYRK